MTKKIIGVVVAVVLIAALAGALYLLNQPDPATAEESVAPVEVLYVVGQATPVPASSVTVTNEHGTFTVNVENADGDAGTKNYLLAGMEGLPVAKSALASVADTGAKLIGKSLVSENSGDLALYGLDKPSATIEATLTDGSKNTILVGDAAPGSEGYYVTADSQKTYLVSASNLSFLTYRDLDFMDKTITGGDREQNMFKDATLGGTVRPEAIVIKKSEGLLEGMYSTHLITEPVYADLDTQYGIPVIQGAYALTADSVVGVATTDAVLEEFGLKEPYSTLWIDTGDVEEDMGAGLGAFTLSASEPDADGNVNLRISTSKLIYRLPASSLTWLDTQVHKMMSKTAILPHIDKVGKVVVQEGDAIYEFALSGEGDELVVTFNEETLDTANFRKFYQNIIAASFDSIPEEPLPEGAQPFLTFTYEYKEAGRKADVVKFYEGPARKAYITLNDGTEFLVPSTYIDKVMADIPKLVAGETVTTYL